MKSFSLIFSLRPLRLRSVYVYYPEVCGLLFTSLLYCHIVSEIPPFETYELRFVLKFLHSTYDTIECRPLMF
jgi:hypothetical protein